MQNDFENTIRLEESPNSGNEVSGFPDSATSPLQSKKRKPFRKLSNLVNTLEAGRTKIHNSTRNFTRSMPLMPRFSELSVFDRSSPRVGDLHDLDNSHCGSDDEVSEVETENDKTLDDEDFLSSPSVKEKPIAGRPSQSLLQSDGEIRRCQSLYQTSSARDHHYRDNSHLNNTPIRTFTASQDLMLRIDENEMYKIISGQYDDHFDEYIVIDCRFPYEFNGGHIINAMNVSDQNDLEERLIANHSMDEKRRLLIFHCEYSIFRGPTMASHLRKIDRIYNADCYPRLFYPDIVVLEGGYKKFFDSFKECCTPQAYVEMKDIKHKRTCQMEMSKVLQASKLTRARSFNQFNPQHSGHNRSMSYFTPPPSTDYASTWSFPASGGPPSMMRKKNSSKIHKRQDSRRDLKLTISQSNNFSFPTASSVESPTSFDAVASSTYFDDDLVPPSALLRNHSKCLSLLSTSINSSALLLCSENYSSAFTSSDSLHMTSSPFNENKEFFDTPFSSASGTQIAPNTKSPCKFSSTNHHSTPGTGVKLNRARLSSMRPLSIRTPRSHGFGLSSPTTSSPLTTPTPASTNYESVSSSNTVAVLDKINDTPVHFSLGYRYPPFDVNHQSRPSSQQGQQLHSFTSREKKE